MYVLVNNIEKCIHEQPCPNAFPTCTLAMTDLENTDSVRSEAVVKTLKILLPGIKHVASIVPGCEGGNNYMCRVYRVQVRFGECKLSDFLAGKSCK